MTAIATTNKGVDKQKKAAGKLLDLVEASADKRKQVSDLVEPHVIDIMNGLIDLAKGILIECPPGNAGGERISLEQIKAGGVRCYKKPPDPVAAGRLLYLYNTNTQIDATAFMTHVRAMQTVAEVEADVALAKARNLNSQTDFNLKQTEVFDKSLVDEDEMNDAMLTMAYEFLGIIQSESREMLAAASVSDEAHSKRTAHIGNRVKKALQDILSKQGLEIQEPMGDDEGEEDE